MATSTPSPSPIDAPAHVLDLLSRLHKLSLEQESNISETGKVMSTAVLDSLSTSIDTTNTAESKFDALMLDKFIALDQDKCEFIYQLINAMSATNIVEAGTSFGVSTIYLALAVTRVAKATGKKGVVVATEKEESKAEKARGYWRECGRDVESVVDLRVGDLRETLKADLPESVDLVLLDIWTVLALPTLKLVLPKLRYGAVVLTDNPISGAKGYADLLAFLRASENGFSNVTLPFTNGLEMSVYLPRT